MRRLDDFVPADHPLRRIRVMVNDPAAKCRWRQLHADSRSNVSITVAPR
jgi:hypothetical protein